MKDLPKPPEPSMGPFPLEANLRRLKPSLARLGPIVAGLSILFAQEEWWERVGEWFGTTTGIIIVGLLTATLLFFVLDLYLKQVWYNERGIGIAKAWGGSRTWYSFDELKGGQFHMRKRSGPMTRHGRLYRPSSRLTLNFHTGSVRLWPNLYDSKGVYDLLSILSRRFPNTYAPPEMPKDMKKDLEKELQKQRKESAKKQKPAAAPGQGLFGQKGGQKTDPAGKQTQGQGMFGQKGSQPTGRGLYGKKQQSAAAPEPGKQAGVPDQGYNPMLDSKRKTSSGARLKKKSKLPW
ncbi:hypothetical protein KQI52_02955 [bacterium]|nr:hypothetical protein [bacterium]